MKKIFLIILLFFAGILTIYASVTTAKIRKSGAIPWQGTWDVKYDSSHNVGNTYEADSSRFSFVNGTEKGENVLVKDSVTKLIWESSPSKEQRNWEDSMNYCESLTKGGYDDWRLPTIYELHTLVDYSRETHPFINTKFFTVSYSSVWWGPKYWSSTEHIYSEYSKDDYFDLSFYSGGHTAWEGKNYKSYSICVRSDN